MQKKPSETSIQMVKREQQLNVIPTSVWIKESSSLESHGTKNK